LKPAAIDHGRSDRCRSNTDQALQGLAACYHLFETFDTVLMLIRLPLLHQAVSELSSQNGDILSGPSSG
jgi:hypothetical protein